MPPTLLPIPRQFESLPGTLARPLPLKPTAPPWDPAVTLTGAGHPQGYSLTITPQNVQIKATDPAGAFYAKQTLAQLQRQYPTAIPCCRIEDYPDFPVRAYMLD